MFIQSEICVLSDLHFGVHQNSPLWHKIALDFASNLKDALIKHGIKDILIAGDVFHNRNDIAVNTLNVVAEIFNLWSCFNIVILVGNHDAYYKDRSDVNSISILNGWKNIKVYNTPTLLIHQNTKIAICPWGTTIEQIPEADIIFGHFEIVSFKMNNFKVCDHGFTAEELFNKGKLVISGHFHLREERVYQNGTIIYLGSPYELDWGDKKTKKGAYILNLDTKKYDFFYENNFSPKHIEIKLSELITNGNLNSVKSIIPGNIIKFIIDKEIDSDKVDILSKKLNSYQPFSFNIEYYCFNQADQVVELQADLGVDIAQTIDEFVKSMDINNKEKVSEYILELYNKTKQ